VLDISVGTSPAPGKHQGPAYSSSLERAARAGGPGGGARAALSFSPPITPASPASAPAAALDRDRNNFSPEDLRRSRRRRRYDLWAGLARVTDLKSLRKCGRAVQHDANGVGVRIAAREDGSAVAGFSHLYRCGSVWACPRCAPKVAHWRADDLADLLKVATERGCSGTLMTFTIEHHWGQRLEDCWGAVAAGWHAVTSGKQWRSDEAAYGFVLVDGHPYVPSAEGRKCADCGRSRGEHEKRIPWVRVVEVTTGPNGWHVHIHALLLWKGDGGADPAMNVAARAFLRWQRAVQRKGFDCSVKGFDIRGAKLRPGNMLHEYFTKLANEVTGGHAKLAKGKGRTPFQVLGAVVDAGGESGQFEEDLKLWRQWEKASKGRRQVAYSKGLREWAGLRQDKQDEEIASETLEAPDDLEISPRSWADELAHRYRRQCEVMEAAESGGYPAVASLLDGWGVSYVMYTAAAGLRTGPADDGAYAHDGHGYD